MAAEQPSGGSWFDQFPPTGLPAGQGTPPPSTGGGGGGDPQQQFQQIMGGLPATPANLTAKEAELKAAGFEVQRNASGIAGKIKLRDGEIIDVVPSAGTGGGGSWQWLRGADREGTAYYGGVPPERRHLTGGGGGGGGVNYASRQGALEDTPGFKFRLDQGIQALDRSAASKGTLLSGGHLKELAGYASGLASQEYGAEWDRTMGLAELGARAAGQQGQFGSSYGTQMTDLTTGAGNAQAAGTAASGQAYGGMFQNLGDLGMQYGIYSATRPGPMGTGTTGTNPYGAAGRYYPAGTFNV